MLSEKFKNKKVTVISIGAGLVAIILFLIVLMSKPIKLDMEKFYDISFVGLDGKGEIEVTINEKEYEKFAKKLPEKESNSTMNFLISLHMLDYSFSKDNHLSNGEEITFTVDFPEKYSETYNIKAVNTEMVLKVSGLDIPTDIDVFEGIELEFRGKSPLIFCKIVTDNCNEFTINNVSFEKDKFYYEDGETITISANYNEDDETEAAVRVVNKTAEFVAKSNEKYLEKSSNADLSNINQKMLDQLELEHKSSDELFCAVELGWTNHYAGKVSEEEIGEAFLVLNNPIDFDEDDTPFNMYVKAYKTTIKIDHRSKGNEEVYDKDFNVLLIAKNLYEDENNVIHCDELIEVKAEKVDSVADFLSVFTKNKQRMYSVVE